MLNKDIDWILVSGASCKLDMLSFVANEHAIANNIRQLRSPIDVNEKNHFKSSKYIYLDKATQTWDATRHMLGENLGIMNDVHPKTKKHGSHQYLDPLVKYKAGPGELNIYDLDVRERQSLLAKYIHQNFSLYEMDEAVDVRQSSGVVPFFATAMIALLVQKTYIHYPTNPIPSMSAAHELLSYSAIHNFNPLGLRDNLDLNVSANSAGGILHKPMIEWYAREHKNQRIVVDTTSDDPLVEVDHMGCGFTQSLIIEIARLADKYTKPERVAKELLVKTSIPFHPKLSFEVIWDSQENRCVALPIK